MGTSFSTIVGAVKPRERTAQLLILAALYHLKAHSEPCTLVDVKALLKRHRAKQPANLATSLRRYVAFVEPTSENPIRWLLKPQGVQKLSELCKLNLAVDEKASGKFEYDIAIVCALPMEFDAVRNSLAAFEWKEVGQKRHTHIYRETTLITATGKELRVVATVPTSMGLTAAAIATTQLVMLYKPRLVVMIGIAAGTKKGNKQFGDVLVADPSVDYSSGKFVEQGGNQEFFPDSYPIGLVPRVRSLLQRYEGANAILENSRRRWIGEKPNLPNRLHIGAVGAADQVVDDSRRLIEITKHWRKLIGIDMETYAVYRACHESPEPKPRVVSFKSICDFAEEKSDDWQPYAAFMAATFAADFLKTEWDNLWPEE